MPWPETAPDLGTETAQIWQPFGNGRYQWQLAIVAMR
jgi:hypothetical protein